MAKAKKSTNVEKKNLEQTEIVVILDRSGSMGSIEDSAVEGFNTFLKEQQNAQGEAFITLVQFDDRYEMNYQSIPVKNAIPLVLRETYSPRGSTALLDAIGKTIEDLKTDRDVVFVIITDGEENASRTYTKVAINKMIETLTKDGWKFIFLAANQDAIAAGNAIGIKGSNSMSWRGDDAGTTNVFMSVSSNTANYRSAKASYFVAASMDSAIDYAEYESKIGELADESLAFSKEQRDEQK